MSKLYIFAIGGTGSRILRSLTMMLASGVKIGVDEIVPIIFDPDKANADLTRTVSLLNDYNEIQANLSFSEENKNRFFRTGITKILPNYTLHIKDTDNKTFRQFISYAGMSKENKSIIKMLFSDKNLNSSMDVGFKGNPNIGSVVLNQIAHSDDFDKVANDFSEGDRIFIISSIFGGTGASGFPLLLKTLRNGHNFPNFNIINNSNIGALTVLPYFKVQMDDESEIDSTTFIGKTKSALAYYENNIANNGSINALYYLGDLVSNTYDNNEGGASQQNDAHLIEFLGATAIINFSNSKFTETSHFEVGIKGGGGAVTFNSFYKKLRNMLYTPMVQFTLMANALTYNLEFYRSNTFSANNTYFNDLYDSQFFNSLYDFFNKYKEWLKELKNNKRSLNLFSLNTGNKPFELVTDIKPKKNFNFQNIFNSDYEIFTGNLNKAAKKLCKSKEPENRFLEMFYLATEELINKKLNN